MVSLISPEVKTPIGKLWYYYRLYKIHISSKEGNSIIYRTKSFNVGELQRLYNNGITLINLAHENNIRPH